MSATKPLFPLNDLPLELQREIFLVAANADTASALRLVLVARRVKEWVQPHIYDMVTLGNTDTELFVRTMESMPPDFIAINVKRLCLSVSVGGDSAAQILRSCTGVVDLAFWLDYLQAFPEHSLSPLISPLPLLRLSIEISHYRTLLRESAACQWCETLTHLDIIFWFRETSPVIPYLDKLPSLSHLLLRLRHNRAEKGSLLAILSACKALKILVIYDESDRTEDAVLAVDPRVVKICYPAIVIRDWESRAKLDWNCTWSRAEELVRKQKHAAAQRQGLTPAREALKQECPATSGVV